MIRALGPTQREVLRCLENYGPWFAGGGWNWDTTSNTARILASLARRGFAEVGEERNNYPSYKITREGRERLMQ
jgi:hypothetical protein